MLLDASLYLQSVLCQEKISLSESFGTITEGDKLEGSNYALWSFMLRNILVGKGLWDIVSGDETRPGSAASSSSSSITSSSTAPTLALLEEQRRFDRRNT